MLTANELPEDLLTQILLRLPVVSLLRFKCVCKLWYALITRQNFITKHLRHNNNSSSNTHLLLQILDKTTGDNVVSTLSYETLQLFRTQHLPPPYPDKEANVFVAGSCNGLVCLFDFSELRVVIWNPATNETKVVPKSNLPRISPAGYSTRIESIRFGFDAKTNDYKIIILLSLTHPFSFQREQIAQTEVYSLSADSWRKVDGPPCFIFDSYDGPRTYINGMASWLPRDVDWKGVLSFDMSHEVFLKTLLPDDVIAESDRCRHFFVLNELIAMAVSNRDVELSEICFDIWLLLEVGVKDSWTKLSTVGPFTEIRRLLGFWKNETMLLENSNRQLVLYDPSTKEMTNLQTHGDRCLLQLVNYMETLVSVKGGNEFEK